MLEHGVWIVVYQKNSLVRCFAGKGHGLLRLCLFMLFALAFSHALHAQEALVPEFRADTSRGFGRLEITLPGRTKFIDYKLTTEDNVLVLRLGEPITVDLQRETIPLQNYILVSRQDPEGNVLRFALAAGVRVNTLTAGEHLFLDFLPNSWRAENPSIPLEIVDKLEKRAEDALQLAEQNAVAAKEQKERAELKIRIGRNQTFTRLVFNWNVPFKTTFQRQGNIATLEFDRPSDFDFGSLNSDLPSLVRKISGTTEDGKTTVSVVLHKSAQARSYLDGNEYIVDLTNDELLDKNIAGSAPFVIGGLPELPKNVQDVSNTVDQAGSERALAEIPQSPVNPVPVADAAKPAGDDAKPLAAAAEAEKVQATPVTKKDREATAPDKANSPKPDSEPSRITPETVDEATKKIQGLSTVDASINEAHDSIRLIFPFEKKTPSAVFRRGKSVWMVFKTDDVLDISSIQGLEGNFVHLAEVIENGPFKAVRLLLSSVQLASAAVDDNSWVISIGNSVIRASEPLTVSRKLGEHGFYLNVPLTSVAGEVVFQDPSVGDNIHVLVADAPSRGLVRKQDFVMLTILPSTHALAFVPVDSSIWTRIGEEGVAIESSKQLNLSAVKGLRASASGKATTDEWYDFPLEITANDIAPAAEFAERERGLVNDIVNAPDDLRAERYVDLAKFYVANGFGPEGLAALGRALLEQPLLGNKRLYVLTKAVAELELGRYEDTLKTLSGEAYAKDQDAAIWRTIAARGNGDWPLALSSAALGRNKLAAYSEETQQDFFLAAAEAALNLKDLNSAKNYLTSLILRNASEYYRGRYEILQGKLAVEEGRLEDARFFFDRARKIDDIRIEAAARLSLIMLDHDTGAVDNKTTIEEFERFVAIWRNDDLELLALRALSQALIEEKEYRRAFQTVQTATISNNDSPITRALQDDMKGVFVDLFQEGKADSLPPIEALSLFYDFRHLSPIGRVGDEIVRYLSRRLIDLDLLPQAAELLTHQVEKRLRGVARARVAADLAVVELLDHKPHRALTTLHKSRVAGLPIALDRQRRLVEAYALSEVGKHDIALELLDRLDGEDVERLRANINWDARRWAVAGELLEKTHSGRWADIEPLDSHVRLDILRAAIAYSLAKDDFALNRLVQKFGQKMSESSDSAVFQVLTQPLDEQNFDRDVAVDSILNIGTVDSFLRDYRKRYLTSGGVSTES